MTAIEGDALCLQGCPPLPAPRPRPCKRCCGAPCGGRGPRGSRLYCKRGLAANLDVEACGGDRLRTLPLPEPPCEVENLVGLVRLGVEVGAACSLRGDQRLGKQGEGVLDFQIQALGEAPLHLERPGIEAHFPAWWAVLALKGPAWAAPSTMNFLKSS